MAAAAATIVPNWRRTAGFAALCLIAAQMLFTLANCEAEAVPMAARAAFSAR